MVEELELLWCIVILLRVEIKVVSNGRCSLEIIFLHFF
jgi:hypothetical protein